MTTVVIDGRELVVRLTGWERVWSLRREIRVPLAAVTVIRAAPDLASARPAGARAPGSYVPIRPSPLFAGSYFRGRGRWEFWCLVRARPAEIVEVLPAASPENGKYGRLVVQVDDREAVVVRP